MVNDADPVTILLYKCFWQVTVAFVTSRDTPNNVVYFS
jgi:hypothetical protein